MHQCNAHDPANLCLMELHDDQLAMVLARRCCRSGELRELRQSLGYSLTEVAKILGVDTASVSRWERGVVTVKGQRAIDLGMLVARWLVVDDVGADARAKALISV